MLRLQGFVSLFISLERQIKYCFKKILNSQELVAVMIFTLRILCSLFNLNISFPHLFNQIEEMRGFLIIFERNPLV